MVRLMTALESTQQARCLYNNQSWHILYAQFSGRYVLIIDGAPQKQTWNQLEKLMAYLETAAPGITHESCWKVGA